jgi:cyclopropane fatty-acyl-phospholipid synthase-like methyltransferase
MRNLPLVWKLMFLPLLVMALTVALPAPAAAQEWDYGEGLDVPYVPTPPQVVEAMLKLAGVKKGELVIDLGCGDGRIVVAAARDFGARGMGYDLNPERIKEANANAEKAGVQDRVKFVEKNLFEAEIKDANVVTLYLLPSVNEKLKPRLLAELKPGTRVVSHSFTMGDWAPEKKVEIDNRTIYLWIIPAKTSAK